MNVTPILILHYTYGWTQSFLRSWEQFMPDLAITVINNNPLPGQIVRKTRGFWGDSRSTNTLCQKEFDFVCSNKLVRQIIQMPRDESPKIERLPSHGDVLDFAFNSIGDPIILHIEPDCLISGRKWLDDMKVELDKGKWVVGSKYIGDKPDYVMPVCPTLWAADDIRSMNISFNKVGNNINTGQLILSECRRHDKASWVDVSGTFAHFEGGSGTMHPSCVIKI